MPAVISIVGHSGSGKTTLIVKLVGELKKRGYKIGTIKHAAHGFDVDREGKDSQKHKAAGADTVILASPDNMAMIKSGAFNGLNDLKPYVNDLVAKPSR